ncbi:MAG: hypothetical protein HN793_11365 [Rhodospirillaceae bacterium]|jgi:hypothetical protein|nr:hypothetical protein [Rhodospirillaceae bacterium]MBT5566359.1 hypothetical protein [Rhodospirillaceae bacterium]MBT6088452.1 hypothetical protein [Rhodospirillaceae bacterium]MBT6960499.1 hypothetical protein [Rhodospirillaceae bacterium]MBT7451419.1 hypothetical protein [Rhodospirillaceae bacterium]
MIRIILLAIAVTAMGPLAVAQAQSAKEYEEARDIVWAKEQAIYKARAETGLDYYIANASPNYVGWPPGVPKPSPLSQLKKNQSLITAPNSENIQLFFDDFAMHGDTGVIYYNTHRTMLPNGTEVDQRYHTIHVWVKDTDDDWKLMGAMARQIQ